jgi:hypothetical protein
MELYYSALKRYELKQGPQRQREKLRKEEREKKLDRE